jgi:dsDNA-binding SOS-regulon protein
MKPPKTDDRLAILAVELGLAGAQVLQEKYGFTQAQSAEWLDAMLDKAKANRGELAKAAVEQIDNDQTRER